MTKFLALTFGLVLAACTFTPAFAQSCITPSELTRQYEEVVTEPSDRSVTSVDDVELSQSLRKQIEGLVGPAPFGEIDNIIVFELPTGKVFVTFFYKGCQVDRGGIFLPTMVFIKLLTDA